MDRFTLLFTYNFNTVLQHFGKFCVIICLEYCADNTADGMDGSIMAELPCAT